MRKKDAGLSRVASFSSMRMRRGIVEREKMGF